jgi:signal transduction histidine kinase
VNALTPVPALREEAPQAAPLPCAAEAASLARRAGALSHDFKHLMTILLGAAEQLAAELPAGGQQQALARICQDAAERGAGLLDQILSLNEAGVDAGTVDCGEVADIVARFLRQAASGRVQVATRLSGPVACRADRAGLERALLNLGLNAADAMPNGGVVTLAAAPARLGAAAARRLGLTAGRYAQIAVSDTGTGMSPQVLARACEPFFTTKGAAGTGLGLVSVRDFAESAGGAFDIASREGEGARATLYLPLA